MSPGTTATKLASDLAIGSVSRVSAVSTSCCTTFCTSTTGLAPVTVTVSSTPPTDSSTSTVAVKPAFSVIPSRMMVAKPGSVKVTVYSPGRRSMMLYSPPPSVKTVRDPSISAGLAASTVTPGSTPPVVSDTCPAMPCAAAGVVEMRRRKTSRPPNAASDRRGIEAS